MANADGAGLLEIPDTTNARGLRETGCLPDAGPGLSETAAGMSTEEIRSALISGELSGLVLFGADPLRDFAGTPAWEEALTAADFVVCFSMHENATTAKADVVFPLETHAEKDGTVTHPDGRLQRVRPSAGRPGYIQPNIAVLSELAKALGLDTGISSQPTAFAALTEAVPFYSGITDEQIGGRGLRWQDHSPELHQLLRPAEVEVDAVREQVAPAPRNDDALPLGTYRYLWAGPITELNPPLKF